MKFRRFAVSALLLMPVLAACSAGVGSGGVEHATPAGESSSTAVAGPPENSGESAAPAVPTAEQPEALAGWNTEPPIIAPTFTEEEALQLRDAWIMSNQPGLPDTFDVSQYPVVRWVDFHEDRVQRGLCLNDAGYSTKQTPDGSWQFDPGVPESQEEALELASAICMAQYPLLPEILASEGYSPAQLRVLYDYWTGYYLPCVSLFGKDASGGEIPSKDSFVANWRSEDGHWDPIDPMGLTSEGELVTQISAACPFDPPTQEMYG